MNATGEEGEPGGRVRWLIALAALTALALGLRWTGLGFLLPHQAEPDLYLLEQSDHFRQGGEVPDGPRPGLDRYPHLLGRLLAATTPAPLPEPAILAATGPEALPLQLAAASRPIEGGRRVLALLATLLVPATWFLARRFSGPGPSLLAAALIATSLLHLVYSSQFRPHGALATFTTLALLADLHLLRRGGAAALLLAGLATALAVGCLHNGLAVVPAGLVAFGLRPKPAGRRPGRALLVELAWLALPVALVAGAVALFYPFLFGSGGQGTGSLQLDAGGARQAGHRLLLRWLDGAGFGLLGQYFQEHDPVLLALGAVGAGAGLLALARGRRPGRERARALAVVLAFALPYGLLLGLLSTTRARYALPLLPPLAVLAAYGARRLADPLLVRLAGQWRMAAGALLAVAVLALPTWAAARLAVLHARPDSLSLAAAWMDEHLDPSTDRVLVEAGLDLPLRTTPAALALQREQLPWWTTPWQRFQTLLPVDDADDGRAWNLLPLANPIQAGSDDDPVQARLPDSAEQVERLLARTRADWALVGPGDGTDPVHAVLARRGRRVAGWEPCPGQGLGPSRGFQVRHGMLSRVLCAQNEGPAIELWRLGRRKPPAPARRGPGGGR